MPLRKRPVHFLRGFLRLLWDISGAFGVLLVYKKCAEQISSGFFVQMAAGMTVELLHVLLVSLVHWSCIQAMKKEHEEATATALQALLLLIHAPVPPKQRCLDHNVQKHSACCPLAMLCGVGCASDSRFMA